MRIRSLLGLPALLAGAVAIVSVMWPSSADAQMKNLWDKIKDSSVLMCGAMAANPLGSWAVPGPAKYEGYEINLCRQIAL